MGINLDWRIKLFKDKNTTVLFKKIIEEYVNYSKQDNFKPIFILLPQKDDILFIKIASRLKIFYNKKLILLFGNSKISGFDGENIFRPILSTNAKGKSNVLK